MMRSGGGYGDSNESADSGWPLAAVFIAVAFCIAVCVSEMASCTARTAEAAAKEARK